MNLVDDLRDDVLRANLDLASRGLARFTFGNASAIARRQGLVVIKPSGIPYDQLRPHTLVVTTLDGAVVEGELRPSSDLRTHLALYRAFPDIGGVVHTHSHFATVWAQAGRAIPCLGTTHADSFHGPIPCTDPLTAAQVGGDYEAETGAAIVRRFQSLDPGAIPAVLVHGHASFCWGATAAAAVETAAILEEVARMAWHTVQLAPEVAQLPDVLRDRHFLRKHGGSAYYGQPPKA
jgi:L-ribulose-5-phosphate 4-epimerase